MRKQNTSDAAPTGASEDNGTRIRAELKRRQDAKLKTDADAIRKSLGLPIAVVRAVLESSPAPEGAKDDISTTQVVETTSAAPAAPTLSASHRAPAEPPARPAPRAVVTVSATPAQVPSFPRTEIISAAKDTGLWRPGDALEMRGVRTKVAQRLLRGVRLESEQFGILKGQIGDVLANLTPDESADWPELVAPPPETVVQIEPTARDPGSVAELVAGTARPEMAIEATPGANRAVTLELLSARTAHAEAAEFEPTEEQIDALAGLIREAAITEGEEPLPKVSLSAIMAVARWVVYQFARGQSVSRAAVKAAFAYADSDVVRSCLVDERFLARFDGVCKTYGWVPFARPMLLQKVAKAAARITIEGGTPDVETIANRFNIPADSVRAAFLDHGYAPVYSAATARTATEKDDHLPFSSGWKFHANEVDRARLRMWAREFVTHARDSGLTYRREVVAELAQNHFRKLGGGWHSATAQDWIWGEIVQTGSKKCDLTLRAMLRSILVEETDRVTRKATPAEEIESLRRLVAAQDVLLTGGPRHHERDEEEDDRRHRGPRPSDGGKKADARMAASNTKLREQLADLKAAAAKRIVAAEAVAANANAVAIEAVTELEASEAHNATLVALLTAAGIAIPERPALAPKTETVTAPAVVATVEEKPAPEGPDAVTAPVPVDALSTLPPADLVALVKAAWANTGKASEAMSHARREADVSRTALGVARGDISTLTSEKAGLEKTIDGLRTKIAGLEKAATEAKPIAEATAKEIEGLKAKITGLETAKADLEKRLAKAEADVAELLSPAPAAEAATPAAAS